MRRVILVAAWIVFTLAGCGRLSPNAPDAEGNTPLMLAAAAGDERRVVQLLDRGADPNYQGRRERHYRILFPFVEESWEAVPRDSLSPLMVAAQVGHAGVIRLLTRRGAEPDRATHLGEPGRTALVFAVRSGHQEAALALLDAGARDATAAHRALHDAIERRHLELARALVSRRAGIQGGRQDASGWSTPLTMAAREGHEQLLADLLAAGVDIGGERGGTALRAAAERGHVDVVRLLLAAGADHEVRQQHSGAAPLVIAAGAGHVEIVKALLDAGARVDATDGAGMSPLARAAERGHEATMALLESHGAPRAERHGAALIAAARVGDGRQVRRLLAAGADPDVHDDHSRRTPLMLAALAGHRDVVGALLAARADVEAADTSGMRALGLAVIHGDIRTVRDLLDAGAQVPDGNFANPLPLAVARGRHDLVELLAPRAGAAARAAGLVTASEKGVLGALKALARGLDETALGAALVAAAREGQAEAVHALLGSGAPAAAADERGVTALMWAAFAGNAEAVRTLAGAGADHDARLAAYRVGDARLSKASGWTALLWAAGEDRVDAVAALLALGADVHVADSRNRTALDYAVSAAAVDVAEKLVAAGARAPVDMRALRVASLLRAAREPGSASRS